MEHSEPGLCANVSGVAKVAGFSFCKSGANAAKAFGVLIGASTAALAGECLYEQHYVNSPAFGAAASTSAPTTRGTRCASSTLSVQPSLEDRLGFHTFRRGDIVSYIPVHPGEHYKAWLHLWAGLLGEEKV
eukprot:4865213-Pleurochrysis_carterae.AAC.2